MPRAWPLFEILITQQHTYQMPSIPIVSLALCSYFHVHLCLSSFPVASEKEGKQKHLFTPLLSRGDLEGGSVLGPTIPLKWAMIHTSPQPIGSGLCLLCASVIGKKERRRRQRAPRLRGGTQTRGVRAEEIARFNPRRSPVYRLVSAWSL